MRKITFLAAVAATLCTVACNKNMDAQINEVPNPANEERFELKVQVRSGGDLTKLGGDEKYAKTVVCPDGCVIFRLTAKPLGNENFHTGGFWDYPDETQKQKDEKDSQS